MLLSLTLERGFNRDVDQFLLKPMPAAHQQLLATIDAELLAQVLERALDDGNVPIILPAIQALGDRVYVAYAKQDTQARSAVAGAGLGVVDVFDTAGNMLQRLIPAGGQLNAPWGMAMAPAGFGTFSNALLVGNVGDGKINAFNPTTGAWMGALSSADGTPIAIDGLHGIAFGNGLNNQPTNTLFFAAGPAGGTHGAYGRIDSR